LDSRAPMPFGALLSAGWNLIQATIGDASVQPQRRKTLIADGRNRTGFPWLLEVTDLV